MPGKTQEAAVDTASQDGAVIPPNAFQLLIRKMASMAVLDQDEVAARGEAIIPILTAETEEEMWDADELARWNSSNLSGSHIQIMSFRVMFSPDADTDIKTPFVDPITGRQMFLLVDSFRLNNSQEKKEFNLPKPGEVFTWNTSAKAIVGKLFWMLAHGWFDPDAKPVRCVIEGTPLGGGRAVEKLKPLPAGATIVAAAPVEVVEEDKIPF